MTTYTNPLMRGELTTEHPDSINDIPVLVIDGTAYADRSSWRPKRRAWIAEITGFRDNQIQRVFLRSNRDFPRPMAVALGGYSIG